MTATEADAVSSKAGAGPIAAARRAVVACAGLLAVLYTVLIPAGDRGHFDHFTYLRTIRYMQDGEGYYDAMRLGFLDGGITLGHARAYRMPTAFLVWRWIPEDVLWGAFLLLVVVAATALLARITPHPWLAMPVACYLLLTGRMPGGDLTESWLLVEYWSIPLLAGGVVAWQHRRDGLSAALFCGAAMLREISAPVLVFGLIAAHRAGRDRRPWLAALCVFGSSFALHLSVAAARLEPPGNDAVLWGTGTPPSSIVDMATWMLPGPPVLWLAAWGLAVWQAWRRDLFLLLAPVLGLPVLGLFVDRPYWGLVVIPFVLVLAGEAVVDGVNAARRRAAAGAGSSPPPGTPGPGPGSPVAAGAPPSAGS